MLLMLYSHSHLHYQRIQLLRSGFIIVLFFRMRKCMRSLMNWDLVVCRRFIDRALLNMLSDFCHSYAIRQNEKLAPKRPSIIQLKFTLKLKWANKRDSLENQNWKQNVVREGARGRENSLLISLSDKLPNLVKYRWRHDCI